MDRLVSFAREIDAASSFEQASSATLEAALDLAGAALRGSSFAKTGRLLRAMVHLRPDDGYLRLVALDAKDRGAGCRMGGEAHVPSASVWRWIRTVRGPVALDVGLSLALVLEGGTFRPSEQDAAIDFKASRMTLAGRDVTHLLAIPLRLSGGRICGMIALEAACPEARSTPFIWGACAPDLEMLAAIASQHLAGLPITEVEPTPPDQHLPVIGEKMQGVVEMLRVFSQQEETILIRGPTGSGKTRLAEWCHHRSPRRQRPYEVVDLSTVPEELQMGELFGWRQGAFTGADRNNPGKIARAEGGTLFIDEIDKLSLKAQGGLLRVLEDRLYHPLGGELKKADVRFLVGTNADLLSLSREGAFREDLYYRINVLPVRTYPLSERRDEIAAWARHMLARHAAKAKDGRAAELSEDAVDILHSQEWPGNLRQLDNIVRRACALSLVGLSDGPDSHVVRGAHVAQALSLDGQRDGSPLWRQLERACAAFVEEAERRAGSGGLSVDLLEGVKGLALEIARRRPGTNERDALKRAFLLLGREAAVKDRNHNNAFRREMEKTEALRRAIEGGEARE